MVTVPRNSIIEIFLVDGRHISIDGNILINDQEFEFEELIEELPYRLIDNNNRIKLEQNIGSDKIINFIRTDSVVRVRLVNI